MPKLQDGLSKWVKSNYMPPQLERVMCLAILDARKDKERLEN